MNQTITCYLKPRKQRLKHRSLEWNWTNAKLSIYDAEIKGTEAESRKEQLSPTFGWNKCYFSRDLARVLKNLNLNIQFWQSTSNFTFLVCQILSSVPQLLLQVASTRFEGLTIDSCSTCWMYHTQWVMPFEFFLTANDYINKRI